MKGYSASPAGFLAHELRTFELASRLVAGLPESGTLRCHELARAVQRVIMEDSTAAVASWRVCDGQYGLVDHSWLNNDVTHNLLDVYAVGQLPMVRLVMVDPIGVRHVHGPYIYQEGKWRNDIDVSEVGRLVRELERIRKRG
jgi:hypothetical protein